MESINMLSTSFDEKSNEVQLKQSHNLILSGNQMGFTEYLKYEFVKKIKINKSFSLRSYARFLDIHFATLSQLLSGKRVVTEKTIRKISPRLNVSDEVVEAWVREVTTSNALSENHMNSEYDLSMKILEREEILLLSEWYHDAILELVLTKDFKKDVNLIAQTFDISYLEASDAVSRLFKLGLLKKDENENWIVTHQFIATMTNELTTSLALRNYQIELLKKSLESIELIPIELRAHSSLVVAISKDQLAEFREEIKALRKKINQMSAVTSQAGEADSVYCFCFSAFPLGQF